MCRRGCPAGGWRPAPVLVLMFWLCCVVRSVMSVRVCLVPPARPANTFTHHSASLPVYPNHCTHTYRDHQHNHTTPQRSPCDPPPAPPPPARAAASRPQTRLGWPGRWPPRPPMPLRPPPMPPPSPAYPFPLSGRRDAGLRPPSGALGYGVGDCLRALSGRVRGQVRILVCRAGRHGSVVERSFLSSNKPARSISGHPKSMMAVAVDVQFPCATHFLGRVQRVAIPRAHSIGCQAQGARPFMPAASPAWCHPAPFPQSLRSRHILPMRPGARLFEGFSGLIRPPKSVCRPPVGPIKAGAGLPRPRAAHIPTPPKAASEGDGGELEGRRCSVRRASPLGYPRRRLETQPRRRGCGSVRSLQARFID